MKAFQVSAYGEDATFHEVEVDKPQVTAGHVLLDVRATSLNPVDFMIRTANIGLNPTLPATLHMDVAGIVVEVGEGVDTFKPGDEVYGCAGGLQGPAGKLDGALADYMLADANLLANKPKSLGFGDSASLPLVSITAYEALLDRARMTVDDHVLVHAGTGGVGHVALQMAKILGAKVATTVSGESKAQIASSLGADEIINYKSEDLESYVRRLTDGRGFDIVFDTVGGPNLDLSFQASRANGQVCAIIGMGTHDLTPMHLKGLTLHLIFMLLPMLTGEGRRRHGEIMQQVAAWADAGKLKPLVNAQRFQFEQANEAHALFASGKQVGKIVLERS